MRARKEGKRIRRLLRNCPLLSLLFSSSFDIITSAITLGQTSWKIWFWKLLRVANLAPWHNHRQIQISNLIFYGKVTQLNKTYFFSHSVKKDKPQGLCKKPPKGNYDKQPCRNCNLQLVIRAIFLATTAVVGDSIIPW